MGVTVNLCRGTLSPYQRHCFWQFAKHKFNTSYGMGSMNIRVKVLSSQCFSMVPP